MIAEAVAAVRSVAASVMGVAAIPSSASLAFADGLPPSPFGAYEIGEVAYEPGPAALDVTAVVPMDIAYVVKRSTGDTDAVVMAKLDALANVLQGCPDGWRATYGIMALDVTDARIGPFAFDQTLADSDSPYTACRLGIALRVAWGPYAPNPAPTATYVDTVAETMRVVATFDKNAYYPFDSKSVVVKSSTDVVMSNSTTWSTNDTTATTTWTHNELYTGYTVTYTLVYDGVTTVLTHNTSASE